MAMASSTFENRPELLNYFQIKIYKICRYKYHHSPFWIVCIDTRSSIHTIIEQKKERKITVVKLETNKTLVFQLT